MHPAAFDCVNNSESKLCRLDILLPRGHRQTTIVKLSKRTFVCVLWSTINSKPQRKCWFDKISVLDTTITWVATSWKQMANFLWIAFFFIVKQVLNRIWKRCILVFTKMVFDSRLQLCDRKTKQEHFWIILWRSLELLKGNKSQKTMTVQLFTLRVNSLKYQFEIVSLYVTSYELFIYYSYRCHHELVGLEVYPYINSDNLLWSLMF